MYVSSVWSVYTKLKKQHEVLKIQIIKKAVPANHDPAVKRFECVDNTRSVRRSFRELWRGKGQN